MAWLLVLLVGAAAAATSAEAAPDWTDCPAACRCKWTSGKKTAVCRDGGLQALPQTLNSDMQVLDISGNSIPGLAGDAFRNIGLLNLQRIFMRHTRLQHLDKDAFRDLIILVELDLSNNDLSVLNPATFTGNDRLRILILSGNPLGELLKKQFPPLPHLRTIELRGCSLRRVHPDAFLNVAALEVLDLRQNLLAQLSEAVFMSTGRLNTLHLDTNPWRCDCNLRGFRNFYLRSNLRSGVQLFCSTPQQLAGRTWESVQAADFACAPDVILSGGPIRADQGGNVSFSCHVRGDPEPEVTWLFNGRAIGSGNATERSTLVIEVEEGLLEKWTNLSVWNVSVEDAGDYSCVAVNSVGLVVRNVTLVLPEVVTASTVSAAEPWLLWLGVAGGGAALTIALLGAALAACVACSSRRRRRNRHPHRRKNHLKESVSFSDQEKKLLDVSIATTTERDVSRSDMEMMEQSPSIEICDPPVHITIESHQAHHMHQHHSIPVTVFPPPPEFSTNSSGLPPTPYGNIFISVSVSQDSAPEGYPDLLDVSHVATLPRRRVLPPQLVHYDNMGPRVTAAGSSTLSLPDATAPEDAIPPPPPPPQCTPHTGEYVSL